MRSPAPCGRPPAQPGKKAGVYLLSSQPFLVGEPRSTQLSPGPRRRAHRHVSGAVWPVTSVARPRPRPGEPQRRHSPADGSAKGPGLTWARPGRDVVPAGDGGRACFPPEQAVKEKLAGRGRVRSERSWLAWQHGPDKRTQRSVGSTTAPGNMSRTAVPWSCRRAPQPPSSTPSAPLRHERPDARN